MSDSIKNLSRVWKRRIVLTVDQSLIVVSLFAALSLQTTSLWPVELLQESWGIFLLLVLSGALISISLGIPGIKLKAYESRAILKTGVYSSLLVLVGAALKGLGDLQIPFSAFVIFGIILFTLCVASRVIGLRIILWLYRKGNVQTRVLIYGAGNTGVQLMAAIDHSDNIRAVGFVDDSRSIQGMVIAGLPVRSPEDISALVNQLKIDRIVLAMPSLSIPRRKQIARRLEVHGCDVHQLPSFAEILGDKSLLEELEPAAASEFLGRNRLDSEMPSFSKDYYGKSVMVSGAGGSIGAELCRQIIACSPAKLVLFEQSEPALYAIDMSLRAMPEAQKLDIVPILGSVCNRNRVQNTLISHGVEIVLHTAAYKHVPLVEGNEVEGLRNNIFGTKTLADAAMNAGVENFVLISSDKAVRPTNVMGASKRIAELIIQDLASRSDNTVFSMVRFGNVLGSSGSVIPLFQAQIDRGGPITLTHQDITRYFMTIPEASRLVLLAGSFARGGDVFVLDMGKPVHIRQLARQMIERAGYTVRNSLNPNGDIAIKVTGLRPGEKLFEELLIGTDMQITPHPKILRALETQLSEIEIAGLIRDLDTIIEQDAPKAARELLSRWVEGYSLPPEKLLSVEAKDTL